MATPARRSAHTPDHRKWSPSPPSSARAPLHHRKWRSLQARMPLYHQKWYRLHGRERPTVTGSDRVRGRKRLVATESDDPRRRERLSTTRSEGRRWRKRLIVTGSYRLQGTDDMQSQCHALYYSASCGKNALCFSDHLVSSAKCRPMILVSRNVSHTRIFASANLNINTFITLSFLRTCESYDGMKQKYRIIGPYLGSSKPN